MKLPNKPAKRYRKVKPELPWQTGDYERMQTFHYPLPYGFLLLCKLWGTTPDDLLSDFMQNLSCGSWKREGRDEAKLYLKQYVAAMGYGLQHYTAKDIEEMFATLESIGSLWPDAAGEKMRTTHVRWRDRYYNWWFKQTWRKYKRKPMKPNMK